MPAVRKACANKPHPTVIRIAGMARSYIYQLFSGTIVILNKQGNECLDEQRIGERGTGGL